MLKIKVLGRELPLPTGEGDNFTLGELSMIKKHYGVVVADAMIKNDKGDDVLNLADPDVLGGVIAVLLRRQSPQMTVEQAIAEVASISAIEFIDDSESESTDPTSAGESAGKRAGKSGSKATTRDSGGHR